MIPDTFLLIYLGAMGIGGAFGLWLMKKRLSRHEKMRIERIERLRRIESIKTTTPLDEPLEETKEAAIEGVETRFSIIKKVFYFLLLTVWLFALIVPFLDKIPATMVSVLVAAAGIIIGMAARPFIENLISGIVISFSHPLRIGDTVIIDGNYGTVEDISITHTTLKIWDWRRYIIPNSRMLAKEFVNCSINDAYQWARVEFWVDYTADLAHVETLAIQAAIQSKYFAPYETPRFWIMEMAKEGIRCWIAAWAMNPSEAWQLRHEIRTRLIVELQAEGILTHQVNLRSTTDLQPDNL